jgi:hypothetical protein
MMKDCIDRNLTLRSSYASIHFYQVCLYMVFSSTVIKGQMNLVLEVQAILIN